MNRDLQAYTTECLDAIYSLQRDASNLRRLQEMVDLQVCDGCGHWVPPHDLYPYGGCLLCPACWGEFEAMMRARDVPSEEWDPNERWENWREALERTR